MAMSASRADQILTSVLNNPATPHVLLHVGDPGPFGTDSVAQASGSAIARKPISFGAPESHPANAERRVLSTADVSWSGAEIDVGQTITHFSVWSAATGGQPEFIAAISQAKTAGSDGVTIPAGQLEVAIGVYAKP